MRAAALIACAAILSLFLAARGAIARQVPPSGQSTPDASDTGSENTARGAQYNPFKAQNDVDVAAYYLRKGDPDASIPRLEEAIQLKPDFAKPRLMLGEIYEKKHDNQNAVKYYKEYLQVLPHAPDAKKIRQKIMKLSAQ